MKVKELTIAMGLLAALALGGCASLSAGNASQRQLFACRFEQPGRGERMLKLDASHPAVAACMARAAANPR